MLIRQLNQLELIAASLIDAEVNLSPWQLNDYQAIANSPQQQLWGIFSPSNELLAACAFSALFEQGEILQLCSAKQQQRQGYARLLLTAVIEYLAGQKVLDIFLEVRADNLAALGLYQELGFNQVTLRKNYYRINNQSYDALLMVKTLCQE